MITASTVVLIGLVSASLCAEDPVFPTTVKFGVATSAYQIEGAWNISDKGLTLWDTYSHGHGVSDGSNGDVACDSYHNWKRDIEMVEELGADFYRFSLNWGRLLPSGFTNHISEDGINYYNNLINGLLEKGIEPLVTIYHWELPQQILDLGGWHNPLIADWFADYARVVFNLFGDRVKTWLTINEPISICDASSALGIFAPGILSPDNVATYICSKNVLIAHAKAWRIYDEEFRPKYKGQISYCNNLLWYEATAPEDEELAELARQNNGGRFSHPVFSKEGGWPPTLQKFIDEKSKKLGYPRSRLPPFTPEEIKLVKGTFDYYGMNFYTSRLVKPQLHKPDTDGFPLSSSDELDADLVLDPSWKKACNGWIGVHPEGIRKQLVWFKQQYGDIRFMITENGFPTCDTDVLALDDVDRVNYYREYLKALEKAMTEDGVRVIGYTVWSLMDNFEWMDGYSSKFGLYAVNFSDPQRTRTPRQSASYFTKIIKSRVYVEPPKIYLTTSYLWYSFVCVLIVLVIVCAVFFVLRRRKRERTEEKPVENMTPLMKVEAVIVNKE